MFRSATGARWRARRIWGVTTSIVVMLMASLLAWSPAPASAATVPSSAARVDLRVLVIDDRSPWVEGLETQMTNEGIPFTAIDLTSAARPSITPALLSSGTHAFFQTVILPDATAASLSAAELTALRAFEATFAVREVDAFVYPNALVGSAAPSIGYDINGATATVTAAGVANGFQYLNGSVVYGPGSYTYFASPLTATSDPAMPAGARFTPLVSAPIPGANPAADGSIIGVYAADGVERLIITSAFSSALSQFQAMAPGILTWATRGVHLGYNRNYFTMHVDDAFSSDNLWSDALKCTPGEDCPLNADGTAPEPTAIRMAPEDVTYAAQWSAANNYELTLAFNGFYADAAADPLTQALQAQKSAFRWLNHGLEHIYQGCVQDFTVVPWKCVTDPTTGAVQYVSQAAIANEIQQNITVGKALGLPFDATEYLSGEHSGLIQNPQQPTDNPNFVAAVAQAKLKVIGADASREATQRTVGGALTIPRHPTAIYYNAATAAQEVSEYNWLYNRRANGGSGYCEDNAATATCLAAPLAADGFTSYIVPTDAAFDLHFILSNDPRPFYAHVSNLAGERVLYPLLNTILGTYRSTFATNAPIMGLTETQAARVLQRQTAWATSGLGASPQVAASVQNGKVTITNTGTSLVPVTVPEGSTATGTTLEAYAGERSAWLPAKASTTVDLPATTLTVTGSPVFSLGQAGTLTVKATGLPAGTLFVNGTVPAGLTLTDSGDGTLTIAGTTTAATGTYPLTIAVTSGAGTVSNPLTLTVAQTLVITSGATGEATTGSPFTAPLTATGFPLPTWSAAGALPSGVTLANRADGTAVLTGTPAPGTGGTYKVTLTASNGVTSGSLPFTLTVHEAPAFAINGAAMVFQVGSSLSVTLRATGDPKPVIGVIGALPAGVTFTPQADGTGVLSGTPTVAGQFPLTLTATNSAGVARQDFSLTIAPASTPGASDGANDHGYLGLTPDRLLDTRQGARTPYGTGSTHELTVVGQGGVPADATAVVLNITATEAALPGYVTVYPCGTTRPVAANLNYAAGQTVANAVTAMVGAGGKVCIFTSAETHVVVDVNGAYSPSAGTGLLGGLTPARLADTRGDGQTVAAGTVLRVPVAGHDGVGADAVAAVVNITATEPATAGFLTVYACGAPRPWASNLNFVAGQTVANVATSAIGPDGSVCVFSSATTHVVVDVTAEYGPSHADGHLVPTETVRALDTRAPGSPTGGRPVGGGSVQTVVVTGQGGAPANATSVTLNVAVDKASAAGYLTVYPCGAVQPLASNLNFVAGQTVSNAVTTAVGANGAVCVFSNVATHIVVDVDGAFARLS